MKRKLLLMLMVLCFLTACGNVQPVRNTETYEFVLTDSSGNTMVYYLCQTTYSGNEPRDFDAVDTQALQDIFDSNSTTPEKTLDVCGYPCAIYRIEDRAFFCCTVSWESTVVLEYPPDVIPEETATKIIQSIFEPVE